MITMDTGHLQKELLDLFRDELALEIDSVSRELFAGGLLDGPSPLGRMN